MAMMNKNSILPLMPGQMGGMGLLAQQGQATLPPGFPNQLGLLAQQMSQGFGGGMEEQLKQLQAIYRPIEPTYLPDPLKPKPEDPDDPKKPDKKKDKIDRTDFWKKMNDRHGWR